ncbi:radical SAM protein [Carboxylicivirga sediminis]|uniref:Radical SAM protein n=1 Tax=Carboxylicivirga sediminis TaxID=2006564 RepID=A0A941F6F7_9BACT|nr:radical SAM protein [Carboxylicivirga sediminis]MBR8537324.1 radical SAM protein [Carboxylicivirga sediminis]
MVLLITPPFTQLNTPYPATAYLKGYLNTLDVPSAQVDLGIRVINRIFSEKGLSELFACVDDNHMQTENAVRIFQLRHEYVYAITRVMAFLKHPTFIEAQNICQGTLLPEASRFNQLEDEHTAFGTMGLVDKAKHYCTLFLEDLSDFIVEAVDSRFGFSRYAERLGRSASSFNELYDQLQQPRSFIENILTEELAVVMEQYQPQLVLITVPFPGNLFGALRIGQWFKQYHPDINISLGGGYVNTELRALKDIRLFEFCDFITLDDGEKPVQCILEYLQGVRKLDQLKRTYICQDNAVRYLNGAAEGDVLQKHLGIPDYSDVEWDKYFPVVEVANPMFRLWSDGHWLKLTLAHGCYWGKCTFCDGSLDYIKRYEPSPVGMVVDRMEALMAQTGIRGFHFVDEAAPPVLLKELALEILKRQLKVVWWTNIRFEKSFTADLCLLLKQSGCIAVAGGLEVASPRVLKLINKGVTLEQVSNVAANLTHAGIMVHAYLMYGFPSQTAQETIDALEVVRQLFEMGIIESGFWHQFALTAHSPVGLQPAAYDIEITGGLQGSFANNDLEFIDKQGAIHETFGDGLKKALFNYMHGLGFDFQLGEWFNFKVPKTQLPPNYVATMINDDVVLKPNSQLLWIAHEPISKNIVKTKGKKTVEMSELTLLSAKTHITINVKAKLGQWLCQCLSEMAVTAEKRITFSDFQNKYETASLGDFNKFINSYTFLQLREAGLIIL